MIEKKRYRRNRRKEALYKDTKRIIREEEKGKRRMLTTKMVMLRVDATDGSGGVGSPARWRRSVAAPPHTLAADQ